MSPPIQSNLSVFAAVSVMAASVLGAGLLTIPNQFYKVGIIPGMVGLLFTAFLNFYAMYMLIKGADESGSRNYEEFMEATIPNYGKYIFTFFVNIGSIGSLVAFLDIIADTLKSIVQFSTNHRSFFLDKSVLLFFFTLVLIFPLCMLRNISFLKYSSVLATFLIAFFVGVICYWGIEGMVQGEIIMNATEIYWGFPERPNTMLFESIFQVLPTLTLAYSCQSQVLLVRNELENNTVFRMGIASVLTSFISFVLYIIIGFFGYFINPINTPGNYIDVIPNTIFGTTLRAAFVIALLFHYPCVHFPMRNSIEISFFSAYEFSWIRHTVLTIFIVSFTVITAIQIPSLSHVFVLSGSFAAIPLCYILPILGYIRLVFFKIKKRTYHEMIESEGQIQEGGESEAFLRGERNEIFREEEFTPLDDGSFKSDSEIKIYADKEEFSFAGLFQLQLIPSLLLLIFSIGVWLVAMYAAVRLVFFHNK